MTADQPEIRKYPVWLYHEDGSWMADVATRDLVAQGESIDDALYNLARSIAGTYAIIAQHGAATTWLDIQPSFGREWDEWRELGLAPPEEKPDAQIRLMTVTRWPKRVLVEFDNGHARAPYTLDWNWN